LAGYYGKLAKTLQKQLSFSPRQCEGGWVFVSLLTDEQVNAALSYRIITQLLNFYKVIKRMASTCPALANAFDLKVKFAECFRLLLSNVTGNLYPSVERTHFFSPTVRSGVGYQ
jgi:hypothetical protein